MLPTYETSCYPTVLELSRLPLFRDSEVMAGKEGLGRLVKGINLSENPEFYRFISEGEAIITTGYSFYQNPQAIKDYVPLLAENDVSAICVKPVRYLKKIPQEMVDSANEHAVPLIVLSEDLSFGEIIRTVYEEILLRETAVLRSSIAMNKMLSNTLIEGAGLEEIAEIASDLTRGSVMILDTVNDRCVCDLAERDSVSLGSLSVDELHRELFESSTRYPLDAGGHSFGQLCLHGGRFDAAPRKEFLSQVARAICLEITQEQIRREAAQKDLSNFLLHLISDPIEHADIEASRAASFGMDPSRLQVVLRVKVSKRGTGNGDPCLNDFEQTAFKARMRDLLQERGFVVCMVNTEEGHVVFLSARDGAEDLERFESGVQEILEPLASSLRTLGVSVGCGRAYRGIKGFNLSNREAKIALVAAEAHGGNQVLGFSRMDVMRLAYAEDPANEIRLYLHEVLDGVLNSKIAATLMQTLECYFECSGNIKQVSEKTFTHYNTALYRLKAIQKATGYDLSNSEERFRLEMAYRLYRSVGMDTAEF